MSSDSTPQKDNRTGREKLIDFFKIATPELLTEYNLCPHYFGIECECAHGKFLYGLPCVACWMSALGEEDKK